MLTIKEQVPGLFAKKLSEQGFIALAFDHRTLGESEGEPRQYENPVIKTEDIQNSISFLCSQENVNKNKIAALGICAGASHISCALQGDYRVKAFASVSGHFSLREALLTNPFVTQEQLDAMYERSNQTRQHYFETGEAEPDAMVYPDMNEQPPEAAGVFAAEVYEYYFKRAKTEWPRYSNHMVPFSFEQLLMSHAIDYAGQIKCPYLGVAGELAMTKSFTERFLEAKTQGIAESHFIKGASHVRAYDNEKDVAEGIEVMTKFFNEHLS
jgi:hypothetical protein